MVPEGKEGAGKPYHFKVSAHASCPALAVLTLHVMCAVLTSLLLTLKLLALAY